LSPPAPHLRISVGSAPTTAVALVLHGGRERGTGPVRPWAVAYLRMLPIAHAVARAGGPHGLAVARLRHAARGWNGDLKSPVADARWALEQIRERFGPVDVALIGHSMGGRTALAAADGESVRTVVALAPWIEPGDPVEPITGRNLLIAHGTNDRTTDPRNSAAFAEAAQGRAKRVSFVAVAGETHPLLHRPRLWNDLAAGYALATLTDVPANGSDHSAAGEVINAALAGTAVIRV
jgi:alpha-beta hydrolase superfamily lysophospholipase